MLKAGADLAISAGQDLALGGSRVTAGDEACLVAGGNLALLAAENSDYSLYDMKKKGSTGETVRQSEIVAQGEVVINAVGNIHADVCRSTSRPCMSPSTPLPPQAGPTLFSGRARFEQHVGPWTFHYEAVPGRSWYAGAGLEYQFW